MQVRLGPAALVLVAAVPVQAGNLPPSVPEAQRMHLPAVQPVQLLGHSDPFGQAGAQFGTAVAVSGDTAVIGASTEDTPGGADAGTAYVFVRSGTTWALQQRLLASDGEAGDFFGVSVSISGDTLVVGAAFDDTPGGGDAGSAYVFVRSGTAWTLQQKITAPDGSAGDGFGFTLSVSGETVVVGAIFDDTPSSNEGSAYVFVRSGTTWSEQQKLLASDAAPGDWFGCSVSISGDTLVSGAYRADGPRGPNTGAAYVFARSGTAWSEEQKLTALDGEADDSLGYRVAVSGDTALIGAVVDDTAGGVDAGSAYVFVRSGTSWSEQQKLLASDGAAADNFGFWLSISGETALVGAPLDDTAGGRDAGSAYVFVRSGTTWSEQQKLVASDGASGDFFGISVSVSEGTVLVGASLDDVAAGTDAGSTHVFVGSGTTWSEQGMLVASDDTAGDVFGSSVSVSRDTVVVGARDDDTPAGAKAGSAYVFVRSGTTWSKQQKLLASDGAPLDNFGVSVSVAGDTAVVGAHGVTGSPRAGSAYVFVRSGTTWSEQQKLVPSDGAAGAFGYSVSVSEDEGTVVVGAFMDDTPGGAGAGSAYVFVRSGTSWTEQQKLVPSDGAAGDSFGDSVSISGDTVVVGAFSADTSRGVDAGSAYVFVRTGTRWSEARNLTASNGAAGDQFGDSVSVSGDTVVVGAHLNDIPAGADGGSAYVFKRAGMTWTERQMLRASDGAAGDQFGYAVSVSGDTVAVGALLDDTPAGANAGSAYVFVRVGATWLQKRKLRAPDGAAGDLFGYPVEVFGQTVVVGAYLDDVPGGVDAGSAHVFGGVVPVELQSP